MEEKAHVGEVRHVGQGRLSPCQEEHEVDAHIMEINGGSTELAAGSYPQRCTPSEPPLKAILPAPKVPQLPITVSFAVEKVFKHIRLW